MQGIEYFSNLRELNCCNNNLSSLDVSSNTVLKTLYCDNNNNLSSLDVSSNTALKTLYCSVNNLSSLDVSHNAVLETLYCANNNLGSLDVTNNTALTYLSCYENNLTSLDVTNNTALTVLRCYENNISSLDVSNNTALTYLACHKNNMNSLDLSKNTTLSRFGQDLFGSEILPVLNTQFVSIPMYKNGDKYYIDLSELPLDLKRVIINKDWMTEDGTTYNSTSGRIYLSDTKNVGDEVRYSYETNAPASSNTKMTVTLKISEVKDITEPTTEEPTTEQPTTEQPTTEQPAVIVPAPTQTGNGKDPAPNTGDATPIYPVIFLLLASFAGGVTLYIRRKQK